MCVQCSPGDLNTTDIFTSNAKKNKTYAVEPHHVIGRRIRPSVFVPPFFQLATPRGFHVTPLPNGNLAYTWCHTRQFLRTSKRNTWYTVQYSTQDNCLENKHPSDSLSSRLSPKRAIEVKNTTVMAALETYCPDLTIDASLGVCTLSSSSRKLISFDASKGRVSVILRVIRYQEFNMRH